jgi:hypothetical protein
VHVRVALEQVFDHRELLATGSVVEQRRAVLR